MTNLRCRLAGSVPASSVSFSSFVACYERGRSTGPARLSSPSRFAVDYSTELAGFLGMICLYDPLVQLSLSLWQNGSLCSEECGHNLPTTK